MFNNIRYLGNYNSLNMQFNNLFIFRFTLINNNNINTIKKKLKELIYQYTMLQYF